MQEILTSLLNQITPILVSVIVGVLVVLIKKVGSELKVLVPYLQKMLENKLGIEKATKIEKEAINVWKIVDEHFRITEFVGDKMKAKQEMFNEKLLQKFPSLTQDEIDDVRQAIAGTVNQGKEAVENTINTISITQEQLTVLQTKAQAYDQIQNTLNATTVK